MKPIFIYFTLLLSISTCFAQSDFTGIIKYKLGVLGGPDKNTDSMAVIIDKQRVSIILYIPNGDKIAQIIFIDDLKEKKSYKVDPDKRTYQSDTFKMVNPYKFINTNGIGAALNNELCIRYKADPDGIDKSTMSSAECLGGINYRNSLIKDYFFLGVQPIIIDNRIVMDFTTVNLNGTRPSITVFEIQKLDNVDTYFDLWGFKELK